MNGKRNHNVKNPIQKIKMPYVIFLMLFLNFTALSINSYAFTFDKWRSGQSINTICLKANQRNQSLYERETGLGGNGVMDVAGRFINKTVNCKQLQDKEVLYYSKTIFEKPCIISLYFTPKSKRLKSVEIKWTDFSLQQLKERSYDKDYLQKVIVALVEKYGEPTAVITIKDALFDNVSCTWDFEYENAPGDLITLDATVKKITLKYTDERNVDLAKYEQKLIREEEKRETVRREMLDKTVF